MASRPDVDRDLTRLRTGLLAGRGLGARCSAAVTHSGSANTPISGPPSSSTGWTWTPSLPGARWQARRCAPPARVTATMPSSPRARRTARYEPAAHRRTGQQSVIQRGQHRGGVIGPVAGSGAQGIAGQWRSAPRPHHPSRTHHQGRTPTAGIKTEHAVEIPPTSLGDARAAGRPVPAFGGRRRRTVQQWSGGVRDDVAPQALSVPSVSGASAAIWLRAAVFGLSGVAFSWR